MPQKITQKNKNMHALINRYCLEYFSVPIVKACYQHGLFDLLDHEKFNSQLLLQEELKANSIFFPVGLQVLESLGLIEKNTSGDFRLHGPADIDNFALDFVSLYGIELGNQFEDAKCLKAFSKRIQEDLISIPDDQIFCRKLSEGAIILPLLAALNELGPYQFFDTLSRVDKESFVVICKFFRQKKWLKSNNVELTKVGEGLLLPNLFGQIISCRPILSVIEELMFGSMPASIMSSIYYKALTVGINSVSCSESDLESDNFLGVTSKVNHIFNCLPLDDQPSLLIGTDRDFLNNIYDFASNKTMRGARLKEFPLRKIDLSDQFKQPENIEKDINTFKHNACFESIDKLLYGGDFSLDENTLYAHAFLEFDFGLSDCSKDEIDHSLNILASENLCDYVDQLGHPVSELTVLKNWQKYFESWADKCVANSYLLLLQQHALPAKGIYEVLDDKVSTCFKRIKSLFPQYLINAEAFIVLAASTGLFNSAPVKRYPNRSSFCRMSLHCLNKRDYSIRYASEDDFERLYELEKLCWSHTRTADKQIRSRVEKYPQGQFVLEKAGNVLGVIYSQRIENVAALDQCNAHNVHKLHNTSGAIIQLLAINIDPSVQNLNYGDQLLEFMLQRCSLVDGVNRVVAVTLCKNFSASNSEPFEKYIHLQGSDQDPVLAFHYAHGAAVMKPMADYRPEDSSNMHNGVLIGYDIHARVPRASNTTRLRPDVPISQERVTEFISKKTQSLLKSDEDRFDPNQPVMEMGLDSADLLKLQQLIEEEFNLKLQSGFFFEYSTINKVIKYFESLSSAQSYNNESLNLNKVEAQKTTIKNNTENQKSLIKNHVQSSDIAIVGMSCKLPGGIDTPQMLWDMLISEGNAIRSYPATRGDWPTTDYFSAIDQGGFISDGDAFDAGFFRISPTEALITDPQQRFLLELAWSCLEDACILPDSLKGTNTGVFIGASNCDYSRRIQEARLDVEAHHGIGSSLAILANRLSYFFDFSGPSMLIDTACSSSLVALHTAIRSLRSEECNLALVGGVNLICHPDLSIAYHKAGMLSPDGQCKVFDASANGYVRSEGAVVTLLKPLDKAIAGGNQIHAVIKGSAVNHGGLAGGLTVPNPQKQSELLISAWKNAGISAENLSYLEMHGTGTPLGDPIEVQGIKSAYTKDLTQKGEKKCAIASIKSNIGHLESAAGITGLLKVILSMQHKKIPATINLNTINPKIDLENSPLYIQEKLQNWDSEKPRIAGVSSFGSGGANAHVVIQEYVREIEVFESKGDYLFVLSAMNDESLRRYAQKLLDWLGIAEIKNSFLDAIYSWQLGRAAMKRRLAIKVNGQLDLQKKLKLWLSDDNAITDIWVGGLDQADSSINSLWEGKFAQKLINQALLEKDLDQLAIIWTAGIKVDWTKLYDDFKPMHISLPTYAFARDKYWVENATGDLPIKRQNVNGSSLLHPLLHSNTSDFNQQSYRSTFSGEEFFLRDHQVSIGGQSKNKILPGVIYLEMVRAGIEQAVPDKFESEFLELRNLVWVKPFIVDRPKNISLALYADETGQIGFDISSYEGGSEIVHCQGQASYSAHSLLKPLNIFELEKNMQEEVNAETLYANFRGMGLDYGVSHQGITSAYLEDEQVLARVLLPNTVDESDEYILHPSLMDAALQAGVLLITGLKKSIKLPPMPFALDSIYIVSPCTRQLFAWVRYSSGSQASNAITKLDIDLCDQQGNICVLMRGFSCRTLTNSTFQENLFGHLLTTPVWKSQPIDIDATQSAFKAIQQHHIVLCEIPEVKATHLEKLITDSDCLQLNETEQKTIAERYSEYAQLCFEKIKSILIEKPQGSAFVQIVINDNNDALLFAGLSGLLKTANLENPNFIGQVIQTKAGIDSRALAKQLLDCRNSIQDANVRYIGNSREVMRWHIIEESYASTEIAFKDQGVYLITGGLGGLGVIFAKEILKQSPSAKIILTGRSSLTSEKKNVLDSIFNKNEEIDYQQVNLENHAQLKQLVDSVKGKYKQLNGIFHCAGMISDNYIINKTSSEFNKVLTPKVTGTFNLDKASQNVNLDFIVLFSSVASSLGNLGQSDYAAANGFMDYFSSYRNELVAKGLRKGKTLSLNWPLWSSGGMQVGQESLAFMERTTGMKPMATETGLHAFYQSLAMPFSQSMVLEGDLAKLKLTLLEEKNTQAELPYSDAGKVLDKKTVTINSDGLLKETESYITKELSTLLKLSSNKIDPQAPLEEYGIDSILAMNLTNRLEQTFGSLSKTLFFEYKTIRELAGYFIHAYSSKLSTLFSLDKEEESKSVIEQDFSQGRIELIKPAVKHFKHKRNTKSLENVAIIGLSGRYPKASNIDAFWEKLRDGEDCIVEIPKERWDWRDYFSEDRTEDGNHYSKWGGFINGVDEFDPRFFNISPREAKYIDPQERLFLQHAWMAVEDAGYTRLSLKIPHEQGLAGQVGVYVGVMYSEYQLLGAQLEPENQRMGFSGNLASIANRVSYVLDLHGPSMTLDTMCSSSLTAIHVACQDLKQGHTDLAIAGGVNISIHPNKYLMLSVGQFISSDGYCQSFGEGGDGYIPGEGVGVVILKRVSEAEKDGDHIYGVIKGSALNHGGKTNGYTVPNPPAQTDAIKRAIAESNVDPRHISYIEAHGTGTKLGDPIEITGLTNAFSQYTSDLAFCSIGSAKSNIGHCESAAGIAGLTKVLCQMKYGEIVPSLHSKVLNPNIDFEKTPFIVNQTIKEWQRPIIDGREVPRIAGISSFGAGGSNAHMILEEHRMPENTELVMLPEKLESMFMIPLSARTAEQLQQKAYDLLAFIGKGEALNSKDKFSMSSMAYTLQVGREAMEERVAFMADSLEKLKKKLQLYIDGSRDIEGFYHGQVTRNKDTLSLFSSDADFQSTIDKWISAKKISKLLDLWVKGLSFDWTKFYVGVKPKRISLPTYPFSKERYWLDIKADDSNEISHWKTDILHPLLHKNISSINQQCYSSIFTGSEFFIDDHTLQNQKILSAAAYLEMARAAIELSLTVEPETKKLELYDMVWATPTVVADQSPVRISLFPVTAEQIDFEIHSEAGSEEAIYCQGRAIYRHEHIIEKVDVYQIKESMQTFFSSSDHCIEQLYQGNGQLLAELNFHSSKESSTDGYVLQPRLINEVLQIAKDLQNGQERSSSEVHYLLSLDSLYIRSFCEQKMFAWVRPSIESAKLDIDLCDQQGDVCVRMKGVSFQQLSLNKTNSSISRMSAESVAKASGASLEIASVRSPSSQYSIFPRESLDKPSDIKLTIPTEFCSGFDVRLSKPAQIKLYNINIETIGSAKNSLNFSYVNLYDYKNGVFSIKINDSKGNLLSSELVDELLNAFEVLKKNDSIKILLIYGNEENFINGGRLEHNLAMEKGLYKTVVSFPYPVISVMHGNASGPGFLLASMCDFMVVNETSQYSYTEIAGGFFPSVQECMFFAERFGKVSAESFLHSLSPFSGQQFKEDGWTLAVVPADKTEVYAESFACTLADMPQTSLSLLKQHLARTFIQIVDSFVMEDFNAPLENGLNTEIEIISPNGNISLELHRGVVLFIKFHAADERFDAQMLLDSLSDIFHKVENNLSIKSIVIASDYNNFLPDVDEKSLCNVALEFKKVLFDLNVPIVAAMDFNATGIAWLIAQYCDACIYANEGRYSALGLMSESELIIQASMIFPYRLGEVLGKETLFTGDDYSGFELKRRLNSLVCVDRKQVHSTALKLAESWSGSSSAAFINWRNLIALNFEEKANSVSQKTNIKNNRSKQPLAAPIKLPHEIKLNSQVVSAALHADGVVVIRMEDRQAKNMFSDELVAGLHEVFEHIESVETYKVVVLSGYDNYFASGGTKQTLLAIQDGTAKFTDLKIYHLALKCKLPVISAMQGHAIGAGWSLGMFADFTIFSRESHYVSPYMSYGFTPGAGATMIFPDKVGYDLARKTLFSAKEYSGADLHKNGLCLAILPREEVYSEAISLATRIAKNSRQHLLELKYQFTRHLREQLNDIYTLELAMHERTFVGQSKILERINNKFSQNDQNKFKSNLNNKKIKSTGAKNTLDSVIDTLREFLAQELHMQPMEIDEKAQFIDLGLDSITGVTLVRKINEKYNTTIEATKIYSYPTLADLSGYVKDKAVKVAARPETDIDAVEVESVTEETNTQLPPAEKINASTIPRLSLADNKLSSWRQQKSFSKLTSAVSSQRIAVIGMAGQFPQANSVEDFWENIANAKNCISRVPKKRWDVDAVYQSGEIITGKTNCQWMGAMQEYDLFDPLFFNISPVEAENMDPQQRLFLQACWHSIENAGYSATSLSGSKCGVFVGCTSGDYHQFSQQQLTAQGFIGSATSILAARTSYFLNLTGPCLSIDTACSSSLVAISNACDSLISGSSDLALAGGVYVMSTSEMHIKAAQAGMLSSDGQCYTFDQRANGFVPGEGVGVVMLKRLTDAEKDEDIIAGVIQGWGVNQDGKTNGITAPNPESQARLQQDIYDKYRVDPGSIQLIETHGTGTKLGDPIEIEGLKESFLNYTSETGYCALGSVKSNIGHCITAAGISGFIKVLMSLKHKQLPPTINFEQLNEHINLEDSPFYINKELKDWWVDDKSMRQAAVSSFGFSGTNSHIVVSEYTVSTHNKDTVTPITENGNIIVPLSARTIDQLMHKAQDLFEFISDSSRNIDILQLAFTLQVGREEMEERLGFMVQSVDGLTEKLKKYLTGNAGHVDGVYEGSISSNKENINLISKDDDMRNSIINDCLANGKLSKLLNIWVKGVSLDWRKLYGVKKPQRINLPVYPFAKERYWRDDMANELTVVDSPTISLTGLKNHPLLHLNTSDFFQQSYASIFNGKEFFLNDHQVLTENESKNKVFPGVATLEMVRVAIEKAKQSPENHIDFELSNIVWVQPIVVSAKKKVSIVLLPDEEGRETVNFEVYSNDLVKEDVLHAQGQALLNRTSKPSSLDVEALKERMKKGEIEKNSFYSKFDDMGLYYGPAHQAVTSVHLGRGELIAFLHLPETISASKDDYFLHPSLMDGALQASLGLFEQAGIESKKPLLPFSLERLRAISPCTEEMIAWVRYSNNKLSNNEFIKFDVDLCDLRGNVCVQMHGFSTRVLGSEHDISELKLATAYKGIDKDAVFNNTHYENIIDRVLNNEISIDDAAQLG